MHVYISTCVYTTASQVALSGKEPTCQCRRCERLGFDPWVQNISWKRKWHPTPIFLLGESNGGLQSGLQRSLVGCSPWDLRVGHNWASEQSKICTQAHISVRSIGFPHFIKLVAYSTCSSATCFVHLKYYLRFFYSNT